MKFFEQFRIHSNFILLSPHFDKMKSTLVSFLHEKEITDSIIFLSSGTTSLNPKGYIFSKEALFANAQAVNHHLKLSHEDILALTLPPFHIGGISVILRAHLLGQNPNVFYPWKPETLRSRISAKKVSVISLVPTQIYDLIRLKIKAPHDLRYVLAGGDFLSHELELKALELGWPIVRTFGMSEVGSQLATAKVPGSKELEILALHQLRSDSENRLWVKTPALFNAEISYNQEWNLKYSSEFLDAEGFFPLPDRGIINKNHLTHLGRLDGKIKISGRLIDLIELKEKLDVHMLKYDCWGKIELVIRPDFRKSNVICLEYEQSLNPKIVDDFLTSISPLRVEALTPVHSFKRNELGKRMISPPSSNEI